MSFLNKLAKIQPRLIKQALPLINKNSVRFSGGFPAKTIFAPDYVPPPPPEPYKPFDPNTDPYHPIHSMHPVMHIGDFDKKLIYWYGDKHYNGPEEVPTIISCATVSTVRTQWRVYISLLSMLLAGVGFVIAANIGIMRHSQGISLHKIELTKRAKHTIQMEEEAAGKMLA